jgi:NADPH2:quinone reductase
LLRFFLVYQLDADQRARAVTGITRALEQGALTSRIGPTFSLAETAAAHEAVEQGTIGNVIVKVP